MFRRKRTLRRRGPRGSCLDAAAPLGTHGPQGERPSQVGAPRVRWQRGCSSSFPEAPTAVGNKARARRAACVSHRASVATRCVPTDRTSPPLRHPRHSARGAKANRHANTHWPLSPVWNQGLHGSDGRHGVHAPRQPRPASTRRVQAHPLGEVPARPCSFRGPRCPEDPCPLLDTPPLTLPGLRLRRGRRPRRGAGGVLVRATVIAGAAHNTCECVQDTVARMRVHK